MIPSPVDHTTRTANQVQADSVRPWYARSVVLSSAPSRLTSLEGLRGYAVFLVFLVHHHTLFGTYLAQPTPWFTLSQFGHAIGNSGVDLFFVLSGFLIYGHLLTRRTPIPAFLRKRLRRIYPTFFAVLCIHVLLSLALPADSKLPHSVGPAALYLLQNAVFLPGIFNIEPLISVSWSLSYEWFFYLCIPILITILRMHTWRSQARVLFFLLVFAVHCVGYSLQLLPHIRLTMFIAGILLFEIVNTHVLDRRLSRITEMIVIVGYLSVLAIIGLSAVTTMTITAHFGTLAWTVLLWLSVPAITLYCLDSKTILSRIFSTWPARWLGNISYSYFLIHGLTLYGIAVVVKPLLAGRILTPPIFGLMLSINFAVTLVAGWLLFVMVEWRYSLAPAVSKTSGREADGVKQLGSRSAGSCAS